MKQQISVIMMLLMMGGVCMGISCTKPAQTSRETIGTAGTVASLVETRTDSNRDTPRASSPALSTQTLTGRVTGASAAIAGSTVTLWAAGAESPQQLAQTRTDADGRFSLGPAQGSGTSLYLVANGGRATARTRPAET